jgi:hypothetical protein
MDFNEKLMKRIWKHIDKTDTCWLSNYALNDDGYTIIKIYKNYQFHRLMLFYSDQTKTAEFADGEHWLACHTCTTKHCVNPSHLYWGTPSENTRDRVRDGTDNRGVKHSNVKLSEQQILEIRSKYIKKSNSMLLASEYGVNKSAIQKIISGKTWSHLH